jgi:6-pyruvoyltetrahydropterin/6-carboxytetrahydropterin synthase
MNPKAWMDYMLDHTTIVAEDDPQVEFFKVMHSKDLIQLRIIPAVGAERFAEYFYNKLNNFIQSETEGRVKVVQVEFREHEKNTAFYKG